MSAKRPRRSFRFLFSRPSPSQKRAVLIEALEGRTLLSTAIDPLQVIIGEGAAKAVQYTDAGGSTARVFLTGPGAATLTFNGTALSQSPSPAGIVVSGSGIMLSSIGGSGTTAGTVLQLLSHGRAPISVGTISSSGSFDMIHAPNTVLTGNMSLTGWLHSLQLAGAQGGTITVGPAHLSGAALIASLGNVADESINSSIPIQMLRANQWTSVSGVAQSIQAPQVSVMNVKGAFTPDMNVMGAPAGAQVLGHIQLGAISGGSWNIGGNSNVIQAGSADRLSGTFNGSINVINVAHDLTSSDLTATSITAMNVHGNLSSTKIHLNGPLTSNGFDLTHLAVGGAIASSSLHSVGSVGAVMAGQMQSSSILIGVGPLPRGQTLPAVSSDFVDVAQLKLLALRRSASASFANSDVAAYMINVANLGTVQMANGGTTFGIAGHQINAVTLTDQTTGKTVHAANITTTAAFDSLLASKGINPQDFTVRIV